MSFTRYFTWDCSEFSCICMMLTLHALFALLMLEELDLSKPISILVYSCEARNETDKAEKYMRAAASSSYATGNGAGDYSEFCYWDDS